MTPVDDNEAVQIGPDPDKLFVYHRQQLSAMLDGELSPDEARFMLRRLQHDTVLASCWERWQVCGDVLRGQRNDLLPADFARRVAQAVAGDAGATPAGSRARGTRPRMLRWGSGAAVAASVALLAVFAGRQLPAPDQAPGAAVTGAPLVAQDAPPAPVSPAPQAVAAAGDARAAEAGAEPPARAPATNTALAGSALALVDTPRRSAARRPRSQTGAGQRRVPAPVRPEAPVLVAEVAPAPAPADAPAVTSDAAARRPSDPFALASAEARPWPRSLLPAVSGYAVAGGTLSPREREFEPFLPDAGPALPWTAPVDAAGASESAEAAETAEAPDTRATEASQP